MDHTELRSRVRGPLLAMPIMYKKDLSLDYGAIERHTQWILEAGITCLCTTYVYSQVDQITARENLELTRRIAGVVGNRAIFFASTRAESAGAIGVVNGLLDAGAHGVLIMPSVFLATGDGSLFVRFIRDVAERCRGPVLLFAVHNSHAARPEPHILPEQFAELTACPNFIGLKEDFNSVPYRLQLIRRYGTRLCIFGGGTLRNYLQVHHYPCQAELEDAFAPRYSMRWLKLLDEGRYLDALRMFEQIEQAHIQIPGLYFTARNAVYLYAMGFGESWLTRSPLASATPEQAKTIIDHMKRHETFFETPNATFRNV